MGLITISVALALKENSIGQLQWKSTIKGAWRNKGLNREKLNSTARPWCHQLRLIKLHTYFSFKDLIWETIFELTDLKSLVTAVEKRGENSVTSLKNKRERTLIPDCDTKGERTLKSNCDKKGENSEIWFRYKGRELCYLVEWFWHQRFSPRVYCRRWPGTRYRACPGYTRCWSGRRQPTLAPISCSPRRHGLEKSRPTICPNEKKITESRNLKIFYSENNKMAIFYIKFF